MAKPDDLVVFIASKEPTCDQCGLELPRGAFITLTAKRESRCTTCADLDHLVFLPSGDAALTRRARKHSTLSAVVVKWSSARRRYERQGVLVEEPALVEAEADCLADEDARERRRARDAERRAKIDRQYVCQFADAIRGLYPNCPKATARAIAEHACTKHSGRVGRSAAAKELDHDAIRLAVIAHIRHHETEYDELLMRGEDRDFARHQVVEKIDVILDKWSGKC